MATDYDCIIIGAGHNGLICACYLAQGGRKVLVLERRPVVGGAVCTEEIVPGYKFDVGSSAHIMFRSTNIMQELGLAEHGLEYIEMDPWAFHPVADGSGKGISFYRDLERTCESIAAVSPHDADAYRVFIKRYLDVNEGVFETFNQPPTPGALFGTIFKRNLFNSASRRAWSSLDTARQLMTNYGRLIDETFESEAMRAALCWLAAQSGPPPEEIATGDLVGWQAMIHKSGAWRAKGGSGSLTQALARCLRSLGGEVVTDAPVQRISRPGNAASGPLEVRTVAGDIYTGRSVSAACHVQTTFLDLLDPAICPPELRHRVSHLRVGNGFGMIVRHAVSELPRYEGQPVNEEGVSPCHGSLQLLCPSRGYLRSAYLDYQRGEPPRDPAVLAMTFSALDPTLAPPGKHVLFTWAQYHPYELSNGENWDSIAEREADKIYEVVCRYAPNMRGALIDRYIQTPLEIERKLGLLRANVMHLEMSLDQMFFFRPLPELSTYATPVAGLYLTGASTHPGGGVFGASGRNTAKVILKDLKKKRGLTSSEWQLQSFVQSLDMAFTARSVWSAVARHRFLHGDTSPPFGLWPTRFSGFCVQMIGKRRQKRVSPAKPERRRRVAVGKAVSCHRTPKPSARLQHGCSFSQLLWNDFRSHFPTRIRFLSAISSGRPSASR